MLHTLVVRRTYRALTAFIPMYAGVHRCVYTAQKKVNVCSAEPHLFTIDVVYTYILCVISPFTSKGSKPKGSKISLTDEFFTVDRIYTGILFITPLYFPMKEFGEAKYYSYIYTKYKIKVMNKIKNSVILFILVVIAILLAPSCTKETINQTPCNGDCETLYTVIYKNQLINQNSNGYYEIEWDGLNYFQIEGFLSELNNQYVINGVPLIEANFDSDYWVVFDSIMFQTPMYSYLGWFNSNSLNSSIPFGNYTYTINDLISLHSPLNVVGYQVPNHFCMECPYAPTLVGTYSKHTYNPTQNILLDNEMIGDTINIFIETIFNPEGGVWYHGYDSPVPKETITDQIKVIII